MQRDKAEEVDLGPTSVAAGGGTSHPRHTDMPSPHPTGGQVASSRVRAGGPPSASPPGAAPLALRLWVNCCISFC